MAEKDRLEQITQRNDTYRDNYRLLIKTAVFLLLSAVCMAIYLAYLCLFPSDPKYYASTSGGQNIALTTLNEPIVTEDFILQWASLAARSTLNINYSEFDRDIEAAKPYYTPAGWSSLQTAMENAKFLKNIQDNKLISSAIINGTPVIIEEAVIGGHYTWHVQLPVLVTYTSGNQTEQSKYILNLLIERVSTLQTAKGIQINNIASISPMMADAAQDQKATLAKLGDEA